MTTSALSFIETSLSALEHSASEREGDLRNIQLATSSPDGAPGLRTLVLRTFERSPPCAEMHSDARAEKVRDIVHSSHVTMLAWSAEEHLQLCFKGSASLHRDDDMARARWDELSPKARDTYGWRNEPGNPITEPENQPHLPPEQQFQQFTVIRIALTSVDVLRLDPDGGQTRARGVFTESGIEANWVGP